MRRVCYVTGSRADFGLMFSTLKLARSVVDISLCITGMHLSPQYGSTVQEVEASGIRICARIPVALNVSKGAAMAIAIGQELIGMTEVFERERPDIVLVLGDRGEMLAGALAAIHLNIPIVHIHGGERSGTVDEPIRHAISKLAHYHFVATVAARDRLIRMGERPASVFVTGAPGLDGLKDLAIYSRADLCEEVQFDPRRSIGLMMYHGVLQEADAAGRQTAAIVDSLLAHGVQALCLMPNSDAGGDDVRRALHGYAGHPDVRLATHFARDQFASWMAAADVMVGNSSSGIIEAATFGLPVVNVGGRQMSRERNCNVIDVPAGREEIEAGIFSALRRGRGTSKNLYGDGNAGARIVSLLSSMPLDEQLMRKSNAY